MYHPWSMGRGSVGNKIGWVSGGCITGTAAGRTALLAMTRAAEA